MNRFMMLLGVICAIVALICLSKGSYVFGLIFGLLSAIDVLGAFETERRARVAG